LSPNKCPEGKGLFKHHRWFRLQPPQVKLRVCMACGQVDRWMPVQEEWMSARDVESPQQFIELVAKFGGLDVHRNLSDIYDEEERSLRDLKPEIIG
jgi:hypothetical protein